jgi:hypothetical protein
MALFKKDDKGDPPAGDNLPADGADGADPAAPQYITAEQFAEQMKPVADALGAVGETLKTLNTQPAQPAQAAPAEDPHKTQKARVTEIDKQLEDLSKKAEDANYQGKGMGELMAQQNRLMIERSDLQGQMIAGQSDPRLDAGFQTLDAISSEVVSAKMPHLALPEVKARYDHYIVQLAPEQRMNPEAKMGAYNLAVGENLPIIEEASKQAWLREADEGDPTKTQDPAGGGAGRQHAEGGGAGGALTPETAFSPEALRSIKQSRHRTPENYVRSLGYEDWDDYAEKNKDHFGIEEEGEA